MSGILDNKSRIIDAMLTVEGRRQMAEGTFEVSYVTFSDADVAYIPDSDEGHVDPTNKIYLEACNLPQDQITFEANDEGKLVAFRSQDIKLKPPGGNVYLPHAEGKLVNGRLSVQQYHHGRRITAQFIQESSDDLNKGFVYSDTTGLTGSVLIDPKILAGKVIAAGSPPWTAFVGTKGGMGPSQFVQAMSGAIAQLQTLGGPNVFTVAENDSLYFDVADSFVGSILRLTGSEGVLPPYNLSSPLQVEEGAVGGKILIDELENASFASQIGGILTSSFDNFLKIQSIASINRLYQDQTFQLSNNELTFDLSKINQKTLAATSTNPPTLNSIDSLFNDDKLSHLDNFAYLPPIVKTSDSLVPDKTRIDALQPYLLGDYPSWGDNEKKLSFSKLMEQLKAYQDTQANVFVTETSMKNTLIGQFFEISDRTVSKLDVVDFGDVRNDAQSSSVVSHRVFFVGKTYIDNRGTTCFVNMFTLIFSRVNDEEKVLVK